ncbi:MAG: hypothetical protein KGL40_10100 [Rhodocyclaceae bacterium]|nr:hypothetical protein [Rhodocyclaceae bacterium]
MYTLGRVDASSRAASPPSADAAAATAMRRSGKPAATVQVPSSGADFFIFVTKVGIAGVAPGFFALHSSSCCFWGYVGFCVCRRRLPARRMPFELIKSFYVCITEKEQSSRRLFGKAIPAHFRGRA